MNAGAIRYLREYEPRTGLGVAIDQRFRRSTRKQIEAGGFFARVHESFILRQTFEYSSKMWPVAYLKNI